MDRAPNGRRAIRHAQHLISLQEQTVQAADRLHVRRRAARSPGHGSGRPVVAAIVVLLSSDKPGKVVVAEADAQRLFARHGLTSQDLVAAPSLPGRTGTFDVFPDWPTRWRSAFYLRQSAPPQCLAPFQRQFVANLSKYKYKPSGPQLDILATIVGNVIAKWDAQ